MNKIHLLLRSTFLICPVLAFLSCQSHKQETLARQSFAKAEQYARQQNADSAVIFYQDAIDRLAYSSNDSLKGHIYNRLGRLYTNNSLYQDAQQLYRTAWSFSQKLEDKTLASRSLRGIGKNFAFLSQPDSALAYLQKALSFADEIQDQEEISSLHNNLSGIYIDLRDYDKALYHNHISTQTSNDSDNIYRNYLIKARIYRMKGQTDSASTYCHRALQSQDLYTQAATYLALARLAKEQHWSNYNEWLEQYYQLKDSINQSESPVRITATSKELEKIHIHHAGEKRLYWVILLFLALLPLGVYHQIKLQRARRKTSEMDKQLQHSSATIEQLHQQLTALQAQLAQAQRQQETQQEQQAIYDKLQTMQQTITQNLIQTGEGCLNKFRKSTTYDNLCKQLSEQNGILSLEKQARFQQLVLKDFKSFVQYLQTFTPLSQEDIYLCCLSLAGFSTKECACCRGVSNEAIRSQKNRIKEKLGKSFGQDLLYKHLF
ncbi:MAG: tetratricopeptide repeat protein [Bacteroidaceae bacterium]